MGDLNNVETDSKDSRSSLKPVVNQEIIEPKRMSSYSSGIAATDPINWVWIASSDFGLLR